MSCTSDSYQLGAVYLCTCILYLMRIIIKLAVPVSPFEVIYQQIREIRGVFSYLAFKQWLELLAVLIFTEV